MTNTTNFNLIEYEGSDLFNPLSVENVNMQRVDLALKQIQALGVGTATEVVSGTVHALTRQPAGFGYAVGHIAAVQRAADARDSAVMAAVVAALGDL